MKLTFVDQLRLCQTDDGRVWGTGGGRYSYYSRFLEVFDSVQVVTRIEPIVDPGAGMELCDGPGVTFVSPPLYVGPWEYMRTLPLLKAFLRSLYVPDSAYLLRVPSQMSFDFAEVLRHRGHPFGLLVVADPLGDFSPGAARSILRPYLRRRFKNALQVLCREAAACAYVTNSALQRTYPSRVGTGFDGVSDVEMPVEWLRQESRTYPLSGAEPTAISVGSLSNMAKGADILIEALAILARLGRPIKVTFVGTGKHRSELVRLAQRRGVSGQIQFIGASTRGELKELLDNAGLFLMPSRTEGMPRALLEAMGRALPCVTTNVGGMPEVLSSQDMIPPNDPAALAAKLMEVLSTPDRLAEMSRRNLETAKRFGLDVLLKRHLAFQSSLQKCTIAWCTASHEQTHQDSQHEAIRT
jgi:glycosyltransferase involved in cell wall biosynthesis